MRETTFEPVQNKKQNYISVCTDLRVFGKESARQKTLHGMTASILCLQSALNFFINGILISKGYSSNILTFPPNHMIYYPSSCCDFVLHAGLETWPYT
jgi:hypothetical protein